MQGSRKGASMIGSGCMGSWKETSMIGSGCRGAGRGHL